MFNRKYKKGMADAAKAYKAFGKKQEEALKHILEEVRQGKRDMQSALKEIDGHIDNIYDYLQSKEKATLYTVYTPFDLKELGEKERLFLVGALFRLTMDKVPNEDQQNYLRAVQKYLEIREPPFGTDPLAIENIEDLPTQKAILQAVLEFLRLQDGDSYDETELQQEFLDAFSVNNKGRQEIMEHIELLYTATGAKGLAEKYGYVPEEEETFNEEKNKQPDETGNNNSSLVGDYEWDYNVLTENQVADIYDTAPFTDSKNSGWYDVLCETENYYIYSETIKNQLSNRKIKSFNKKTCEIKDITHIFSGPYGAERKKIYVRGGGDLFPHQYYSLQSAYIWKDTLFFDDNIDSILKYDIEKDKVEYLIDGLLPKLLNKEICGRGGFLESPWVPFCKDSKLYIIHADTKEKRPIRFEGITIINAFSVTALRNFITFLAHIPSKQQTYLCCYNATTEETTILVCEDRNQSNRFPFFPIRFDKWATSALYSISNGIINYAHILSDCVEVATITFEDDTPTVSIHKFPSDTRSGTGTEFFVDKDFVGFISSEHNKNLYVWSTSENEFSCVVDRCGGDSYFDQRLYRIGNYIYIRNPHTGTTQYRISMDQTNQKKLMV